MTKLKIAVYAISKNEEQFVQRFCDSAKDADLILIADTGSTDNTVELALQNGVKVYDITIYASIKISGCWGRTLPKIRTAR